MFVELEGVGHFLQRYSLYATLIGIGVLVASNNIMARTIRPDEIGQGAIWTSFVQNETTDVIVETAPAKPLTAEPTMAVGGRQVNTVTVQAPTDNTEVMAVGQGHLGATDASTAPLVRDETVSYTVVGGDTVSTIAARYELRAQTLLWANGMSESDYIKPGQILKIPAADGVLYAVKKGDTLNGIANK
jgi:LysM repeat protein